MKYGTKTARVLWALAALSLAPSYLFIEAELVSRAVRNKLPLQEARYTKARLELARRSIRCAADDVDGKPDVITLQEVADLYEALLATGVTSPFQSQTLFWSLRASLPYTHGIGRTYEASLAAHIRVSEIYHHIDLCRPIYSDDPTELREEEERSRERLSTQRQTLDELDGELAAARAAYEADRPKLSMVAWSLGLLQLVGWGLLYFFLLPQTIRTWRQRRAEKSGHI